MSSRTYARLSVEEFGRQLIESGDLDPIYIALSKLDLDSTTLNRWLLAYWCCYDAGVSCYLANRPTVGEFWEGLKRVAENRDQCPIGGRWRRGSERRHWRGVNAIKSYSNLIVRYSDRPEDMAAYCAGVGPTTFAEVTKRAQEHVAFGPWIGFKIADMAERVMGVPVSFEEDEVFMFDSPREAALMLWDQTTTMTTIHTEHTKITTVVQLLRDRFIDLRAPPTGDRSIGVQEIETVLCKWKSHLNGHYPLFNDIREIREGLHPWAERGGLAKRFLAAMPTLKQ